MNRYFVKYIALLVAFAFCSCVQGSDVEVSKDGDMRVRLWADVGYSPNVIYQSRLSARGDSSSNSGIIDPATDTVINMAMARIDELYTPSYPAFLNCNEPILAQMGRPNPANSYIRDITFTSSAQFFYTTTDYVKYVAWHPWLPEREGYEYHSDATATTVRMPITGDSDIMYGNVTTGSQSEGFDLMTFDHALCIYRIHIYSMQEEDSTIQSSAWGSLVDMQIEDLPTSCILTLPTDGQGAFGIKYEGSKTIKLSDPSNNIFFSPGEKIPVGLSNRRLVSKCVAAPPSDGLLNISLATSGSATRQRVSIARNFKAGYAYDIVLRFSNHGLINADVSVGEWLAYEQDIKQDVDVDMFYNLSNYETANSYIVNSANYGYCFDGTVKGNGDSSMVGGVSTNINPKYIDILWDDTPMITVGGVQRKALTLDLNELSLGRVLFHVQGSEDEQDKRLLTEGNVVIAAYDSEGGNILWTWHIWLTDRVKAQGCPNGYIVQDRNLGAKSSTPEGTGSMDGLYYQWGRPTPFNKVSSGVYGAVAKVPSTTAQAAIPEQAIADPMTLYGAGAQRNDWLASQNNALWGYRNEYTDLEKTIYDPCPPGYMVADTRVWQNIASYQKQGGWQSGTGVNLSVASNNVWYPFQGYIDADGTENNARTISRLWSSVVDLRDTAEPFELQYTASSTAAYTAADSRRNRALPVRCVSSHSTAIVTDLSASQTANCYMIHRPGYYKFKATVRGNGVGSLLPLGGTTTAEINGGLSTTFTPAKVDFLWWQGAFTEVTGSSSDIDNLMPVQILNNGTLDKDGYVLLYVGNYHEGNVGLAAYDVDGEIMWSWHLWFTDKPVDLITGNYTFMDRFIGATHAPDTSGSRISFASEAERMATYGFYYQWGRKDPIMGPPSYSAGTENVSGTTKPKSSRYWVKDYNTGQWSSRTDIDTAQAALIPTVIQHPLTFYKSTALCGGTTSGWFPASFADGYTNVALWGYAVKDYSIQGQTFSKTMHDPCPPGYRTPFHHAWGYYLNNTHYGYTYGEGGGNINFSNNEASFDNYGIVFNKTYFERAWYPFMGYRYPTSGGYNSVGANGWMLTGMPMGQYNTRTYVYTKTYTGQVDQSGSNGGYGSAYAMPARCQKD